MGVVGIFTRAANSTIVSDILPMINSCEKELAVSQILEHFLTAISKLAASDVDVVRSALRSHTVLSQKWPLS